MLIFLQRTTCTRCARTLVRREVFFLPHMESAEAPPVADTARRFRGSAPVGGCGQRTPIGWRNGDGRKNKFHFLSPQVAKLYEIGFRRGPSADGPLFFLLFPHRRRMMKSDSGRVGVCVLQSAGGTGSCPPDETAFAVQYRCRIPLPHIWTVGSVPLTPLCGCPIWAAHTEEVFL